MKSLLLSSAFAVATALVLSGCQKEDTNPAPTPTVDQPSVVQSFTNARQLSPKFDNGVWRGCEGQPTNCWELEPIVIHGFAPARLMNAENGGPLAVKEFISSDDCTQFREAMPSDLVQKLTSGDYVIKVVYQDENRVNFIANKESVSNTDFDFMVQFSM